MSNNIFNQDGFRLFNHTSMNEFLSMSKRFKKFGLTSKEVEDAIQSACDFFHIPMPRMIQDLTNVQNGQTMFVNWHPGLYEDDVLCFNMQQLVDMKVDSKDAFSLVMTHECAHRVLQNTQFPGINNGIWEHELAADFLMGCRAGLWNMDESKLTVGLILTNGSPTHPEGTLRALFIRLGKYKAIEMRAKSIPLSIQNLLNEFMIYRQENLEQIYQYQRKFIDFKMDDMICNANLYSAFLEGKATKDEMHTILKKMMCDSRLMMKLNLAATVSSRKKKMKR